MEWGFFVKRDHQVFDMAWTSADTIVTKKTKTMNKYKGLKTKNTWGDSATIRKRELTKYLKNKGIVEERYSDIAKELNTSERSIYRTLTELKKAKLVRVEKCFPEYFVRRLVWTGGAK